MASSGASAPKEGNCVGDSAVADVVRVRRDRSFVFDPGWQAAKLRAALPLRQRAALNGHRSKLNPENWASAHALGAGYSELVDAVDWLFRFALITRQTGLDEEVRFLQTQLGVVGTSIEPDPANETSYVNVPRFYLAAAALRWAGGQKLPAPLLDAAARARDEWRTRQGGIQAALDSVPLHGGWERLLAMQFVVDFLIHALRGDWSWIADVHRRAFTYLDAMEAPSASGLFIRFCVLLADCGRSESRAYGDSDAARQALNGCVRSWADATIKGEPWDASMTFLVLAVLAFERTVNGTEPSLPAVVRAVWQAVPA